MATAKRDNPIQHAVISLINQQADFDALLNELISDDCGSAKHRHDKNQKADDWFSVDDVIDMLHQRATAVDQPLSQLAASVCAGKVKDILREHGGQLLLSSHLMVKLDLMWRVVNKLQEGNAVSTSTLVKIITKQCDLPLEVAWQLHHYGVFSLAEYISSCLSRPSVIGHLSSRLVQVCNVALGGSTREHRENIVTDLLGHMIRHAHSSTGSDQQGGDTGTAAIPPSRGLKKVCLALLDSIGKKLFSNEQVEKDINIYAVIRCSSTCVSQEALKSFYKRQLGIMLSYNPVYKVSDAISNQARWSYACTSSFVRDSYKQILTVFEAADAVIILKRVLQQQEVNWGSLLSFTSTILLCYSDASPLLQEFVTELLSSAFNDNHLDSLIAAFLLARQCCHERHVWPSYQHWFMKTFGDVKTSAASVKKSFQFLLSFLSDIVPYEPAACLKVHITSPPYAPQGCKMALTDYVSLAKTQLIDLKEPLTSSAGIYEDESSNVETNADKTLRCTERDVQLAVDSFAKTAKLPSNVMEASIFRKPYFVGQFLAELLTPRPLPDRPDVKMEFIHSLLRAGKIPLYLFEKYTKNCERIAAQLLQGVFEVDDEMDQLMLTPHEQLRSSVDQLLVLTAGRQVASPDTAEVGILEQICIVREKLQLCSTTFATSSTLDATDVDTNIMQIADVLLNAMCRISATRGQPQSHVDCLSRLVVGMLPCQRDVYVAFTVRLKDLLTFQSSQLELYHVRGLAGILVHLIRHQKVSSFHVLPDHFTHELLRQILCPSVTSVKFCLRFTCCYLEYIFGAFSAVKLSDDLISMECTDEQMALVPRIIVTSFIHLVRWLQCPASRHDGRQISQSDEALHTLADGIYQSDAFKHLYETCKPSLHEWLQWEIGVSPIEQDILRQDCLLWYLYTYFVCDSTALSEPNGESIHQCLITLLHAILDSDSETFTERGCDMHRVRCKKPSRACLVQLVQNLVLRSTYLDETGGDSWLMKTFEQRIDEKDTSRLSYEVTNCVRVMRCFPAYLLFAPSPPEGSAVLKRENFHRVAAAIEKYWRNHLSCNGGLLSLDCTLYVLQGLAVCGRRTQKHAGHFLRDCPLFEASLLCHWSELKALLRGALYVEHDLMTSTLQYIDTAHDILSSSKCAKEMTVAIQNTESDVSMWHLAAIIYTQFSKRQKSTEHVINLLSIKETCPRIKDIAQGLQEFLIAHLTSGMLYDESNPQATSLLLRLWNEHSPCLDSVPIGRQMAPFKRIHSDSYQRLRPVVCMSAMLETTAAQRTALLCQTPVFLSTVLEVHNACWELYDSGCVARDFPANKLTKLDFLLQSNQYVKEAIVQCPAQQLHSLDTRLIDVCDLEVQAIIWKRRAM